MTIVDPTAQPETPKIATEAGEGRAWWFLDTLAVLRNPEGSRRTPAVIELSIPPGGSPPLHIHDALDDSFFMLDGEVVVRCGEETLHAGPGSYVALPAGVAHTFRVTSRQPARMLLVHADDSFLGFIEAVGAPTSERRLPTEDGPPVDVDTLVRTAAQHDIRIIGPSLNLD